MPTEQEGLEALNQIERTLQEQETVRGIPDLGQVCEQYRTVKPLVEKSLVAHRAHPALWQQDLLSRSAS